MFPAERQFTYVHIALAVLVADDNLVVLDECTLLYLCFLRERQLLCLHHNLVEVVHRNLVVRAEDEAVLRVHVAGDAELCLHVVLHLVVVAVEMVWGYVCDDGDVRLEVIHVVELEAAEFQNIDVEVFGRHLIGVALADVASEPDVQSGLLQKVVDERGCRCLAVASGDADFACLVVASGELYF